MYQFFGPEEPIQCQQCHLISGDGSLVELGAIVRVSS